MNEQTAQDAVACMYKCMCMITAVPSELFSVGIFYMCSLAFADRLLIGS